MAIQSAPPNEAAHWQHCIAQVTAQISAVETHPSRSTPAAVEYVSTCRAYLAQALARLDVLQGRAPRALPGPALTPSMATKAAQKLARSEKKQRKMNKKLRGMAQSAVGSLPAGSPLQAVANTLMDEKESPELRTAALHSLIDAVPFNSPAAPMAKMLAKTMLDDDDDDDE